MRRRSLTPSKTTQEEINLSPLIDVLFILLIFFIVTTAFVRETGVEITRPQAASGLSLDKESLLIAITAEGEVVYDGQPIDALGVRSTLQRLMTQNARPVIIQADQQATADLIVKVIDAARLAGAPSVSIATQEP